MNDQEQRASVPAAPEAVSTRRRPLLFLAAYLLAAGIVAGVFTAGSGEGLLAAFQTFILALFLLPYGSLVALDGVLNLMGTQVELIERGPTIMPANAFGGAWVMLSYLATLILPLAGSLTKKQRTFGILFLAFLGLLILDVAGCSQLA
jgi:hypothetical protein